MDDGYENGVHMILYVIIMHPHDFFCLIYMLETLLHDVVYDYICFIND
jgi:hypothetical protein